ncbi:hypothetical protein [Cystobacter fuscus]|uniref:hypothetical protein n=1 Tax=Cystobacter fuscus TaxID=43 RepID=UPI0012FD4A06|nr:hypothetical protein [Cystobacter fuscus]
MRVRLLEVSRLVVGASEQQEMIALFGIGVEFLFDDEVGEVAIGTTPGDLLADESPLALALGVQLDARHPDVVRARHRHQQRLCAGHLGVIRRSQDGNTGRLFVGLDIDDALRAA